jgi:hypothetical protein
MIKYQNKIQKKVSGFFNGNDMIKYDGAVCKISITTGNTAPSDPILTQVFALEQLADNGLKPCRELNNKLVSVIDRMIILNTQRWLRIMGCYLWI